MKQEETIGNPIGERLQILKWRLRWLNPFACNQKGMRWIYFKLFFSSYFTPTPKIPKIKGRLDDEDAYAYTDGSLFMEDDEVYHDK